MAGKPTSGVAVTRTTSSTDIPPDVQQARRETIRNSIREFVESPRNPNRPPPSLKGVGLYTHADSSNRNLEFRDGQYRPILPQILPPFSTDGPSRSATAVPEDVRVAYKTLYTALQEAQTLRLNGEQANGAYGALPVPELQAHTMQNGNGEVGRVAIGETQGAQQTSLRRASDQITGQDPRRALAGSGITPNGDADARRASIGTGVAPGAGRNSLYDAERDPRRRGR